MKKGSIISVMTSGAIGAAAGSVAIGTKLKKELQTTKDKASKMSSYYHMFNKWLMVRQEGKSLADFFEENQYKTIAIYGMKEFGERLLDELKDSGITVKYIIDKNADGIYADIDVVTPDEELESVDAIVVTATFYFDEIEEMLYQKVDCPVISLEDVLYEL